MNFQFLKKYIGYAKNNFKPKLTLDAANFISEKWTHLRKKETELEKLTRIIPMSVRSLESMVRIATAYSKLRLS